MFFLSFFFFNDPATTGIYPYWHPLSLHDALPICLMLARHSCRGGRGRRSLSRRGLSGPTTRLTTLRARSRTRTILTSTGSGWRVTWRWAEIGGWRSEEHTSELQSLMRSSYAVFCLTKKNKHTKHYKYVCKR